MRLNTIICKRVKLLVWVKVDETFSGKGNNSKIKKEREGKG
jgi:hypothetical protein